MQTAAFLTCKHLVSHILLTRMSTYDRLKVSIRGKQGGGKMKMKKKIDTNLGKIESEFAEIVWANEPVKTAELIKLCSEKLNWKRTTTYTVLKKFCDRNIFCMENSIVTSLIKRDEFYAMKSKNFVDDSFNGSLAAFVSAFTSAGKMTEKEIEAIKKIIDGC